MTNVKLIRMWTGEDVIADLVKENGDWIVIKNPIVAVPSTTQGQIGFAPWSPLLKGKDVEIEVTRRYVVYINDPQDDIIEQYALMFSNITTPPKSLIL